MKKVLVLLLTLMGVTGTALGQGVSVWTHFGDTDLEWIQSEAAAFEAAFGVPVTITSVVLDEIKQQMLLSAPQGEAADIIVPVPHDQIGEMAEGGVLADMSQFATEDYLADLGEQARLAFTLNNRLFGLPMFVEGPALIVNTDLVSEIPETYEAMLETAEELTNGDTYGFIFDVRNFYFAYNWLHSFGGYVFNRDDEGNLDPSDVGLANEGAIQGAEEIRALQFERNLIPAGADNTVAEGLFNEGALGMMYNGPWSVANIEAAGIPFTVVPIPPTEAGVEFSGFMGVQGVLINEFSENKADAANFAKWLTRPAAQVSLAERSGRIPSSQAAAEEVADDPVIAGFAEALAVAEPMPNIPQMGNVWAPMGDALATILEGPNTNAAQALQGAVSQISGN